LIDVLSLLAAAYVGSSDIIRTGIKPMKKAVPGRVDIPRGVHSLISGLFYSTKTHKSIVKFKGTEAPPMAAYEASFLGAVTLNPPKKKVEMVDPVDKHYFTVPKRYLECFLPDGPDSVAVASDLSAVLDHLGLCELSLIEKDGTTKLVEEPELTVLIEEEFKKNADAEPPKKRAKTAAGQTASSQLSFVKINSWSKVLDVFPVGTKGIQKIHNAASWYYSKIGGGPGFKMVGSGYPNNETIETNPDRSERDARIAYLKDNPATVSGDVSKDDAPHYFYESEAQNLSPLLTSLFVNAAVHARDSTPCPWSQPACNHRTIDGTHIKKMLRGVYLEGMDLSELNYSVFPYVASTVPKPGLPESAKIYSSFDLDFPIVGDPCAKSIESVREELAEYFKFVTGKAYEDMYKEDDAITDPYEWTMKITIHSLRHLNDKYQGFGS
jgi:hypothetical protein